MAGGGGERSWARIRRTTGYLVLALIVFAPLAIGTVHTWTRLAIFFVAAIALAMHFLERRAVGRKIPITVPLLALGLAAVATALQLVPLPAFLLGFLSPTAHELRQA